MGITRRVKPGLAVQIPFDTIMVIKGSQVGKVNTDFLKTNCSCHRIDRAVGINIHVFVNNCSVEIQTY